MTAVPIPSSRPSAEQLATLREAVARVAAARGPVLPFGVGPLDHLLAGGGLDGAGLHEIAAASASWSDDAAATLFAAGIAARFAAAPGVNPRGLARAFPSLSTTIPVPARCRAVVAGVPARAGRMTHVPTHRRSTRFPRTSDRPCASSGGAAKRLRPYFEPCEAMTGSLGFLGPRNQVARRAHTHDEQAAAVERIGLDVAVSGGKLPEPGSIDGRGPKRDPAIDEGPNDDLLAVGGPFGLAGFDDAGVVPQGGARAAQPAWRGSSVGRYEIPIDIDPVGQRRRPLDAIGNPFPVGRGRDAADVGGLGDLARCNLTGRGRCRGQQDEHQGGSAYHRTTAWTDIMRPSGLAFSGS